MASIEALLAERDWLRRLTRQLVRDAHLAEDLAQETALSALRYAPGSPRDLRAWLARVARNLAARSESRARQRAEREPLAARGEHEPDTAALVERFDLHRSVANAVMALDEPYRTTLLLRFWEDLSLKETARRLRVPPETVRTRQRRGLALLRARLDRSHGPRAAWLVPLVKLTGLGGAGAGLATGAGALLMSKKTGVVAVLCVLLLGLWVGADRLLGDGGAGIPGEGRPAEGVLASTRAGASSEGVRAIADEETGSARSRSTEAEDLAPKLATLEVRFLWKDTKTPVAGLRFRFTGAPTGKRGVWVQPSGKKVYSIWPRSSVSLEQSLRDYMEGCTDRNGIARFTGLPAGGYSGASVLGARFSVSLSEGVDARETVLVPRGLSIRGRVRNHAGEAVALAHVFLAPNGQLRDALCVTRSDETGRFSIDAGVPPGAVLFARHPEFAPTGSVWVGQDRETPMAIELRFRERAASLDLDIRWPSGVAEKQRRALVVVGRIGGNSERLDDRGNRIHEVPAAMRVVGGEGSLRLRGLGSGRRLLQVLAPAFAPHESWVTFESGKVSRASVELRPGGTLRGKVRDAETGEPVPFARVSWRGGLLRSRQAYSDGNGRFELGALPLGRLRVHASVSDSRGDAASISVDSRDMEVTERDIEIRFPARVHGRLVDETGRPLVDWNVGAHWGLEGTKASFAKTDRNGLFQLRCQSGGPFDFTFQQRLATFPAFERPCVSWSAEELVFRVPRELTALASLTGRVQSEGGARPESAVLLRRVGDDLTSIVTECDAQRGGRFEFQRLSPGDYEVFADSPDAIEYRLGSVSIRGGALHDMGILTVRPRTDVEVRLRGLSIRQVQEVQVSISRQSMKREGDRFVLRGVPPGEQVVNIRGRAARTRHAVVLEPGGERKLTVDILESRVVTLELAGKMGRPAREYAWRLFDDEDELLDRHWVMTGSREHPTWKLHLAKGSYRLHIRMDDGRSCDERFTIHSLTDPSDATKRFVLR